jgi:glycosyltransferase involved in cell wall biosynthesis
MPVWNGASHLRESIDSILAQTERNFEFLIIDDGSTDDTVAIIESYQDARIRLIQQEHEGIVVALNRGVAESRADWIARMDADDIAYPQRLDLQLRALAKNPSAILCYSDIKIFGEDANRQGIRRLPASMALLKAYLCYSPPFVHPTVVFLKQAFAAVGGYLHEERHAEDFGLWGRLISQGEFVGVRKPLLNFRIHLESISKQKADTQRQVANHISVIHCRKFLGASEPEANKIIAILRGHGGMAGLGDWLWLGQRFLSRLAPQSFELWAWFFLQALRRVKRSGF